MQRIAFVALIFLLLGSAGTSAMASGEGSAVVGKFRRMTETSADSDCIGDPRTPVCAVETLMACFFRHDQSLCEAARSPNEPDRWQEVTLPAGPPPPGLMVEYVITKYKVIREADIPADLKDAYWMKPGFIEIETSERECPIARGSCSGERDYPMSYSVEPVGDAWGVIAWVLIGGPE